MTASNIWGEATAIFESYVNIVKENTVMQSAIDGQT